LEAALTNSLYLQLSQRDVITEDEKLVLLGMFDHMKSFGTNQEMAAQGDRPSTSMLLVEGFAARFKTLSDGERQITAIHVPGDFLDLHGFLLKTLAHGVVAVSPSQVALVAHSSLRKISEDMPHLSRMLWLDTLIDGSVHREWLVGMGRRSSEGHLAHLVCELFVRLQVAEKTAGMSFHLPMTQTTLADVLGMSVVHANRTVQSLRRRNVITWDNGRLHIDDWERLQEIAEFDPTYLCLAKEPR
jgi:CRP-like cAMP-binding protein